MGKVLDGIDEHAPDGIDEHPAPDGIDEHPAPDGIDEASGAS